MAFTIRAPLVLDLVNRQLGVRKTPAQVLDVSGLISSDSPLQSTATAGNPAFTMTEGALIGLDASYASFIKADTSSHGIIVKSNVTNSGTNSALAVDTVNSLTGSTSLLSLSTNGTLKWKFSPSTLTFPDGTTMNTAASGGGGGTLDYIIVKDEGSSIVNATALNFVGSGVTATDGGGGVATITIGGGGSSYFVPTPGGDSGDIQYIDGCISMKCIQDPGADIVTPGTVDLTQSAGDTVLQSEDDSLLIPRALTDPYNNTTCSALLFPTDAWNENYGSTVVYSDGTTEIVADPSNFGTNYSENIWHGSGCPISANEAVYGLADDANTGHFSYPIWYKYNFVSKVWTALTSANWNGCSGSAVYDGGNNVFVTGSTYGVSTFYHGNAKFHKYRISNDDWDNGGLPTQPSNIWPYSGGSVSSNGDFVNAGTVTGGTQVIGQMLLLPSGLILVTGTYQSGASTPTNLAVYDPTGDTWTALADGTAETGDPFYVPQMYLMASGDDVLMVSQENPTGGNTVAFRFVIYNITGDTYTANWVSEITGGNIFSGSTDRIYGAVLDADWGIFGESESAMVVNFGEMSARYADELSGDADYLYRVSSTRFNMMNLEGQHPSHNYIAKVDFTINAGGTTPGTPADRFNFENPYTHLTGSSSTSQPELLVSSPTHKASGALTTWKNGPTNVNATMNVGALRIYGDAASHTDDPKTLLLQVGKDATAINSSTLGGGFWNSPNPMKVFSYNLADTDDGGNHGIAVNVLVDTAPADGNWYEHTGFYMEGHVGEVNDQEPGFLPHDFEIYADHDTGKLGQLGSWHSTGVSGAGDIGWITGTDTECFHNGTGTTDKQVAFRGISQKNSGSGEITLLRGIEVEASNLANATVPTIQALYAAAANTGGHAIVDLIGGITSAYMNNGGNLTGAMIGHSTTAHSDTSASGTFNTIQGANISAHKQGSGSVGFLCGIVSDTTLNGGSATGDILGQITNAHKSGSATLSGWVYGGSFGATQESGSTGLTTSNWLVGLQASVSNNGGTVGPMAALRIPVIGGSGTAAPTGYGILIENQASMNATNKYAFMYAGPDADHRIYMTGSGRIGLGNHDDPGAQLKATATNPTSSYSTAITGQFFQTTTPTSTQVAIYGEFNYSGGNWAGRVKASDMEMYAAPQASTQLDWAMCLYSYGESDGPGTVQHLVGYYCDSNYLNAGTVTNNYGIFMDTQEGVAADPANDYAIYYNGSTDEHDWYVRADGMQVIGDTNDENAKLRVTWTDSGVNYGNAIMGNMIVNTAPGGPQVAIYGELDYSGGNCSHEMHAGDYELYIAPQTATTFDLAACLYTYAESDGPGTINTLIGLECESNYLNAGTLHNNYAIYIKDQAGVGDTSNWAIFYTGAGASSQWGVDALGKQIYSYTDNTGSPGANTADTTSGKCKIATSASSVVVTNANVNANTIIDLQINQSSEDTTLTRLRYTCTSGSFTIFGNAAATAAVQISWSIKN